MKISKEAKETLAPLVRDVHGHKMRDIGKEGQMRSGAAFLDLREAATWICSQANDKLACLQYEDVLRILHLETRFLRMVSLVEEPSPNTVESGHIYRRGCWVLAPGAESGADWEIESDEEEVESR